MHKIKLDYLGIMSSKYPTYYHLWNEYKIYNDGRWCIGCNKYLIESINRIKAIFGSLPKKSSPMVVGDYPKTNTWVLLNNK